MLGMQELEATAAESCHLNGEDALIEESDKNFIACGDVLIKMAPVKTRRQD